MNMISVILFSAASLAQTEDGRGYIVKVGDRVPDFKMDMIDGSTLHMNELKGKVVMLQFTASWCKVCREEMPIIEKEIWQLYRDQDLIVIGVDRDEPLEVVKKFQQQMKTTYPLALDPGADIFGLFANKKSGVTRNVIIDKKGNIVYLSRLFKREEFNQMKEVIHNLLKS